VLSKNSWWSFGLQSRWVEDATGGGRATWHSGIFSGLTFLIGKPAIMTSGVPRNFVQGGDSTNLVEDRKNVDLGEVAP